MPRPPLSTDEPDPDMSLPITQGMKRLGMPIAALFGVALLALFATSWFLNRDALRRAVEAQIRAVTGLELVVNGKIDVSVFPGSYVSFHDVGRRADREFAPVAAFAAPLRDRRRDDAAAAYPGRALGRRRQQLDALHRD